jgi:Ca-activated chloride channel family protein
MFNRSAYTNSRPGGMGVLEIVEGKDEAPGGRRFVPLRRTELRGEIVGPLASLTVVHTYGYTRAQCEKVLEALYRFPLPGDAAVTGVRARFGDVEIATQLKAREEAEVEYDEAVAEGRQAALLTRESPDAFTLRVAGIRPDEDVVIETDTVQLARPQADQAGWLLRVPLTSAPRYVREDELESRHAQGQPLALLRDPGHRFALDVRLRNAGQVTSPTHALDVAAVEGAGGQRVRLRDGEVLPDRDFVLTWTPEQEETRPALRVHLHRDGEDLYYLALVAPPAERQPGTGAEREIILLVDHSGSMHGAKWEAADWTVNSFLGTLTERDRFALGLFHNTTKWFEAKPVQASEANLRAAAEYLDRNRDSGGTNLGVALEQALALRRAAGDHDVARHVLVVTDAQVSDAARLLRLADGEAEHEDRRRISVLCIDAAPNSFLAQELAERGGGVAYFLTSNPDEEDITTALEGVLADWGEPVLVNLRLTVEQGDGEVAGRRAEHEGDRTIVDLGDLPRGRALWVAGRVPADGAGVHGQERLTFHLATADEVIATRRIDTTESGGDLPALKALFGARRLLGLEYLMHARYAPQELKAQLARLGYDRDVILAGHESVYAENALKFAQEALKPLLIEESLRYGIACAETGFVAVRKEAGEKVEETAVVASALPAGWSDEFLSLAPGAPMRAMAASLTTAVAAPLRRGLGAGKAMQVPSVSEARRAAPGTGAVVIFAGRPAFVGAEAVLFDSAQEEKLPKEATLTRVSIDFAGQAPESLDRGLELMIYVGDLALPRATARLADLVRAGGERPLNLRRRAGERVRVVLRDANGAWTAGAPEMTVSLTV